MITIESIWKQIETKLRQVSFSPDSDFKWLVEHCSKIRGFSPELHSKTKLSPDKTKQLTELLSRRIDGEPIAYLLGEWDFYGRSFFVGPGVLIPRPETELIIDVSRRLFHKDQPLKIVDFGSGSGCLAITLALEFAQSRVVAVEKSLPAVAYLKKNQKLHGLQESNIFQLDIMGVESWTKTSPLEYYDLIVANPPYIASNDLRLDANVRKYEPEEALLALENGFALIRSWAQIAQSHLTSGGVFLCEMGQGQHFEALDYVTSLKDFGTVSIESDLSGIPRTLVAVKN